MLSDLQIDIAKVVSRVTDRAGFALAGGGAIIILGLVDRATRDLDYFTEDPGRVRPASLEVVSALRREGFRVEQLVTAEAFIRLEVARGDKVCLVDFGHDARRWPVQELQVGKVVAIEELAADKTLALLARAAPRDFVDAFALSELLGNERLCELAGDKDLGFSRHHLAEALAKLHSLDRDRFEVDDRRFERLTRWASTWHALLLHQARRLEPAPRLRPGEDHGPRIGF